MIAAYVDTSCLVGIAFDEPGGEAVRERLNSADVLLASNLLEAEFRSALTHEDVDIDDDALTWFRWVLPDRSLGPEMTRALGARYLRGADLWHVAVALYISPVPGELTFLTLDEGQREAAVALGFAT